MNIIIDYNNLLSHDVGSKEIQGIWEKRVKIFMISVL